MNNFTIKIMTIRDYDAVYELWSSTPGIGLNRQDDSREAIARYLQRNPDGCFVAKIGGTIVGAVLGGHDGRRGTIRHLVVNESKRGLGIGKALVDAVLDNLRRDNISKVWLVVFGDNAAGNAFWEKMVFTTRPDINYRDRSIL